MARAANGFPVALAVLTTLATLGAHQVTRGDERPAPLPTFLCAGDRCLEPGKEHPKERGLTCGCGEFFCAWTCINTWHQARSRWHCERCGTDIDSEFVDAEAMRRQEAGKQQRPGYRVVTRAPEHWTVTFCSDECKAKGRDHRLFRPKLARTGSGSAAPAPLSAPAPLAPVRGEPLPPWTPRGDEPSPFRAAKFWSFFWASGLFFFCVFMIRRRQQSEPLGAPRPDGKRVLVEVPSRPKLDPALGDRDATRVRGELATGSWLAASRLLEATRDPHEREFYVEALAQWPGRPAFLDAWVKAQPRSSSARLLRGRHSIQWAWEARGTGLGATVTAAGARAFLARLEQAEADLREAAALDPADPTPHALLVITARGLELSEEEARARFRAATERCPESMGAHAALLTKLCMKWGGSHEKMFELARSASAGAKEESPLHALVPRALIEYWLMAGDDRARFLDDPKNREELILAYRRWRGSRTGTESKRDVFDLNYFCFGFALLGGPPEDAVGAFARLGDRATEWPWRYFGDPLAELRSARARFAPKASRAGAPPGSAA